MQYTRDSDLFLSTSSNFCNRYAMKYKLHFICISNAFIIFISFKYVVEEVSPRVSNKIASVRCMGVCEPAEGQMLSCLTSLLARDGSLLNTLMYRVLQLLHLLLPGKNYIKLFENVTETF